MENRRIGGATEKQGKTLAQRKYLFYGGCLWMRLVLALFVLFMSFHAPHVMGLVVAVCTLIVAITNLAIVGKFGINAVWWNRGVHAGFCLLLTIIGVLVYYNKLPWFLPGLFLLLNVLYGYTYSFIANPFE